MDWRHHLILDEGPWFEQLRDVDRGRFDSWLSSKRMRRHYAKALEAREYWRKLENEMIDHLDRDGGVIVWQAGLKPAVRQRIDQLIVRSGNYLLMEFAPGPTDWHKDLAGRILAFIEPARPCVFVSHAHKDAVTVDGVIVKPLNGRGVSTWCSRHDIIPGTLFTVEIEKGLRRSGSMIVVVSPNSVDSEWVKAEVNTAFSDTRFEGRVLPVLLDIKSAGALHPKLASIESTPLGGDEFLDVLTKFILSGATA